MADKFLLIDGSSLIHRAFFALPPLTNKKGQSTGAVYGFCNMFMRLLTELKPKYVAVAFDKSRETFRRKMYAEYKAQRKPTPTELSQQFPLTMDLLRAMGVEVLELDNYEADDIVGTLSASAPSEVEVAIVTGDKDEFQLIKDNVFVHYTKKGISEIQIYDKETFAANYEGLDPLQIIDMKGLMGDASDNIPGVPGVGPKTALKLLVEYSSVENVLQHIEDISGKSLKAKLEEHQDMARLSKELATISLEAPVDKNIETYAFEGIDVRAREFIRELGFRNVWERLEQTVGVKRAVGDSAEVGESSVGDPTTEDLGLFGGTVTPVEGWEVIPVAGNLQAGHILEQVTVKNKPVAVTYQVTGVWPQLQLHELQVAGKEKIYLFPEDVAQGNKVLEWLANPQAKKAVCDGKELYKLCQAKGISLQGVIEDIAIAEYLYEAGESSYSLVDVCERNLPQHTGGTVQDLVTLLPIVGSKLEERELTKLYREIELPLVPVLALMENNGLAVDVEQLDAITVELRQRVKAIELSAYEQAGVEFNLKSPKQLGVVLFETLGLPVVKKTKTGYSTDVSVLEQLRGQHPVVDSVLEHRKLSKLLSTYLEGLKPLVNIHTGKIHTHLQQMVTVTGRLSSTEPNLQNIPTRTELGKRMREMFVPAQGYDAFLSCDYSQVELRVLAHISQDHLLLDSFHAGQDVHARTAAEVFGLEMEEVTSSMRSKAKAVNFGIVYGISDYGLSQQLDISRKEAAGYIEDYLHRYEGVRTYMEDTIAEAKKQGYVETLFGRRRYLQDINSSNFNLRSFAERTAINTPIQGTAADIIKIAMIKVAAALETAGLKSRLLLQVHDELLLEIVKEEEQEVRELVQTTMEEAVELSVKLVADVAVGTNWANTK